MRFKRGQLVYVVPEISDILLNGVSAFRESNILGVSPTEEEEEKQYFLEGDIRPYRESELAGTPIGMVKKLSNNLNSLVDDIEDAVTQWVSEMEEKKENEEGEE